jgi:hypothetical protein
VIGRHVRSIGDPKRSVREQFGTGLVTMIFSVVQAGLIALFGLELSGKLDLALKERKMTLDAANAMAALVDGIQKEALEPQARSVLVRRLSMYGVDAIAPLVTMAADFGPYSADVPLSGLRVLAVQYKGDVCAALGTALEVEAIIDLRRLEPIKKLHGDLRCSK